VIVAFAQLRSLILSIVAGTTLLSAVAWADQASVPRIGVLIPAVVNSPLEEGLPDGLREHGYVEGNSIAIEWRRAAGGGDQELRSLAAELAHAKVELIVTFGSSATRAALQATTTLPVVFTVVGDPVGSGFAASLARPGGNGTGLSNLSPELTAKRLELLHELVPQARRIGCLVNSSSPVGPLQFEAGQRTARVLAMEFVKLNATNEAEVDAVARAIPRSSLNAILITGDILFIANGSKIASAIRKGKLPAVAPAREYLDNGPLLSYGPNNREAAHMAATYVDKILKGAKPAELPIEQLSKYELVIDLRAARAVGIPVPRELLLRADEVIR